MKCSKYALFPVFSEFFDTLEYLLFFFRLTIRYIALNLEISHLKSTWSLKENKISILFKNITNILFKNNCAVS